MNYLLTQSEAIPLIGITHQTATQTLLKKTLSDFLKKGIRINISNDQFIIETKKRKLNKFHLKFIKMILQGNNTYHLIYSNKSGLIEIETFARPVRYYQFEAALKENKSVFIKDY